MLSLAEEWFIENSYVGMGKGDWEVWIENFQGVTKGKISGGMDRRGGG